MIGIRFDPLDTLFFRNGTPFARGSAPQDGVASLFPPHPGSVAGAIRAAFALCNGWSGRGPWPQEIREVLGDGPEDLGVLSIDGPFVLCDDQPLFPVPRHLLGSIASDDWTPQVLLRPGPEVVCDLGDVRLPVAPRTCDEIETLKAGDRWLLTRPGLEAVLRGKRPAATTDVVPSSELWSDEPRIGLERDRTTRTAQEGMLYSTRHVRLTRGVSLGAQIAGVPEDWTLPFGRLVPLGGESRLAECQKWHIDPYLDVPLAEIAANRRMTVVALSPLDLDEDVYLGRQPIVALGGARVVSACLSRPQRIGGWDSLARRPLPLRSVLPPGSVLFCEGAEPGSFRGVTEAVEANNGVLKIGARQQSGFGLVALGIWPDVSEVTS